MLAFQSTCLREARQLTPPRALFPEHFNPRAYVRHDHVDALLLRDGIDFNPRAYVRHDAGDVDRRTRADISIHVPT